MSSHFSCIRQQESNQDHTLVKHFNNQSCFSNISINIIEQMKTAIVRELRTRENHYIKIFNTVHPQGLNDRNSTRVERKFINIVKVPYGIKFNSLSNARIVHTGHKPVNRIFHAKKFA